MLDRWLNTKLLKKRDVLALKRQYVFLHYCDTPEWEKVWSQLSAHLQPFLSALSAYFSNIIQKIPYFDVSRQKRVLFNCFATKQCSGMLNGSLWLSVTPTLWHTLALSGSLLRSNFPYTVLDRLSGPLLGSQRRCHADTLSPALWHTVRCCVIQQAGTWFFSHKNFGCWLIGHLHIGTW